MALDGQVEQDLHDHPLTAPAPGRRARRAPPERRATSLAPLEARLGYVFRDRALLTEALTHVSSSRGGPTYQRLEFLGDRVLGLAAARMLMTAYPGASEGDLSRRLAEVVRRETCSAVAAAWELGPHILVGGKSGAIRRNASVQADCCEAVIGAVFLDGGFEAACELVARGFGARAAAAVSIPANPKTALQEWAASHGRPPPTYVIVGRSGPDHAPDFTVAARVESLAETTGTGASRRAAEQEAAAAMLRREGVWRDDNEEPSDV